MTKCKSMIVKVFLRNGEWFTCYLVEAEVWMKSPTLLNLIEKVDFA